MFGLISRHKILPRKIHLQENIMWVFDIFHSWLRRKHNLQICGGRYRKGFVFYIFFWILKSLQPFWRKRNVEILHFETRTAHKNYPFKEFLSLEPIPWYKITFKWFQPQNQSNFAFCQYQSWSVSFYLILSFYVEKGVWIFQESRLYNRIEIIQFFSQFWSFSYLIFKFMAACIMRESR